MAIAEHDVLKGLNDRRLTVWSQMQGVVERASEENRDLMAEEQGRWEKFEAELGAIDRRIATVRAAEERYVEVDRQVATVTGTGRRGVKDERNTALRSMLAGEPGAPRYVDIASEGNGMYVARDLLTTTDGDIVPETFHRTLIAHLIEVSGVMQTNPTVLRTSGGEPLRVPRTTAHSTAVIIGEGTTIPDSDPAFAQVTLGAFKYGLKIGLSSEMLDDTGVDLEGYIAMQAGRALGNAMGEDFIIGAGTTEPRGILLDAVQGVEAAGTSFTAEDLITLKYSVIAPYRNRRNSVFWLMRDSTIGEVRKMRDDSGGAGTGQLLWQPSLVPGAPDMLLGYPIVTDPFMEEANTLSQRPILFGDFSGYFVRLAGAARVERSDHFRFDEDIVTIRVLQRADGALIDLTGEPLKYLQHAAA